VPAQVLPGQQALPGVPQATQMLLLQMALADLHVAGPPAGLSQQDVPRSPHVVQVPALHLVPAAVHAPVVGVVPQQG
jgi:hypothetical protein